MSARVRRICRLARPVLNSRTMLQRLASWTALGAGLLLSATAAAQTVTLPSGKQGVIRRQLDTELETDQINRRNCLDDEQITFQLAVRGNPGSSFTLGAWTGRDCETEASRVGVNATCRRVGNAVPYQVDASPLTLGVQEIVGTVNLTGVTTDAGTTEGGAGAGGNDPAVCDGDADPVSFTLHFLLVDSSGRSPAGYTFPKWDAQFDLQGPEAPRSVTAGIGENRLIVSWKPGGSTTSEVEGYYFFCDPPAGTGTPSVDGGAAGCGAPVLADANACGSALGGNVTSGETRSLTNGVTYGVAVAGRDTFRNYGELSSTTCATPQPVNGFFETYRDAGGKGGGGFCSIGAGRSSALAGLGALALLGLSLRRRAARTRKGTSS